MKKSQNIDVGDLSDTDILKHIMQMNPFKFEQFVGNLLNTMGFKTRVTKPTGDGGVDIEAEHETPTGASIEYVVQVKRHTNIISPKDLQALVGAMHGSKADRCIFITTSSFSSKSVEYAEEMKTIELVDGKKLIKLIREYGVLPETLAKTGESRSRIPVCSADEGMRFGKEAYNRGDYEEALKYFDRVINLEPENDEAWLWKWKSNINKLIFSEFPSKELLKRLSTNQYREKVLFYWKLDMPWKICRRRYDPEERRMYESLEKAVEINPDNIEALSYLNPEKVIELCEERLKINPNDEQVWLNMGRAYMINWKGWLKATGKEAEKCFNKVLELNPKNEEALLNLGICCIPQLDINMKALSYFERCSEINPNNHYYTELVEAIKPMITTEEKKEMEKPGEEEQPKERSTLQEFDKRPVWQKAGIRFFILFLIGFFLCWGLWRNIVLGICFGIFVVVLFVIILVSLTLSAFTPP